MLTIDSTKEELKEYLDTFIWTFKIGDNIFYNLDIIYSLISGHNRSKGSNYAKPISILCVSVIEAILIDFLERLDSATKHFPDKLNELKNEIKTELDSKKCNYQSVFLDEVYQYRRLQNFGYKDLVDFTEKFSILGTSEETYQTLQNLGYFRNRVHIRNYFGNFERNEARAFSDLRTQRAIDFMERIFKYFHENYPRP